MHAGEQDDVMRAVAIDTPRMRLRPLTGGDLPFYARVYADRQVMQMIAEPMTLPQAHASLTRIVEGRAPRWHVWVMQDGGSHQDIGLAALIEDREPARGGDLGAMVLPDWQRRGYTVEALAALAEYGFRALELPLLTGRHDRRNAGSSGVMRRLQFEPTAFQSTDRFDAQFDQCWQLTREAWRKVRGAWPLAMSLEEQV